MREQEIYLKDKIGLKTLDDEGKVYLRTVKRGKHA